MIFRKDQRDGDVVFTRYQFLRQTDSQQELEAFFANAFNSFSI